MLGYFCLVAQIIHIGIEVGAACYVGSHAYHGNEQQTYEQWSLPVYGIGIDAVEPFERLRISAL